MAQSQTDLEKTPWFVRLSESKINYWGNYVMNLSMMVIFLAYDATRLNVTALSMVGFFAVGYFLWTFTEYSFHRWMYHMGFSMTVEGHQKHHDNPTAYLSMPFPAMPAVTMPLFALFAYYLRIAGASSILAGWFFGLTLYAFMHHCLHHYKMPFAWLRHLQSQHRIHHALPESNFGVTMRFWDRVFGTEFVKESRAAKAD
jgi:sterol desaturase/sphingolipid hydroxylase (fatty acid hydroxylase superfamily)